jgi:2,3-dihydroxybenzoate decarboxylase
VVQEGDDVARAIDFAHRANDNLAETVRENPDRFGAFATLATQDPDAAARNCSVPSPISASRAR